MQRKTITLHVHHTFLYIFKPSLHGCNVKLPNLCTCFMEYMNMTKISSFFSKLRYIPFNFKLNKIDEG